MSQLCICLENCTQMNKAAYEYTKCTHTHTPILHQLLFYHMCHQLHSSIPSVTTVMSQIALSFYNKSQAIVLMLTFTRELWVPFKIKYHNICSICAFINHLRWEKLLLFLSDSYLFF